MKKEAKTKKEFIREQALRVYEEWVKKQKYEFTTNWFGPLVPRWKEFFKDWKDREINVLEIGVFEGRSAVWLLDELFDNPKSKMVVIDIFGKFQGHYDYEKVFHENIKKTGREKQVRVIKGNSSSALIGLNHQNDIKFDFIYVDGSHIASDALSDAVLSWELLKDDGIMIFDDYELDRYEKKYNNARLAIDSFLKCYKPQLEIIDKGYQVFVKKNVKENIKTSRKDAKERQDLVANIVVNDNFFVHKL